MTPGKPGCDCGSHDERERHESESCLVGALRSDTHLSAAAARLLALEVMGLAHGLGTLLMADQLTESEAESLTTDYLERLRPRLSH